MRMYRALLLLQSVGLAWLSEIRAPAAAASPTNLPPAVAIVFPPDGVSIASGIGDFQMRAIASDPDGQVAQVQFFLDGKLFATNKSAPYTNVWPGSLYGSVLTAVAIDNWGLATTSAPVNVIRTLKHF